MHRTLRSLPLTPRHLSRRLFRTSSALPSSFKTAPSPPRLPKEDQEIFERQQQESTGAFSTPRHTSTPTSSQPSKFQINQSPASDTPSKFQKNQSPDSTTPDIRVEGRVDAEGKGEELHPNVRRGAPPEFEGDTNPKTGEVGGPKNEPLRWGVKGDWSYNGRVTDF